MKIKVIIRRIILILLGLILGVGIYSVNANSIVGNKLPMPFGYGAAVVMSGSMAPALNVKDLIFVKETKDVSVGDVAVYVSGGMLIAHRVINIDGNTITVKGDANNVADEPLDISNIRGVVAFKIPKIGLLTEILKTPAGIILIIIAASIIIDLSFRRQKKNDDIELDEIREEIRKLKEESNKKTK